MYSFLRCSAAVFLLLASPLVGMSGSQLDNGLWVVQSEQGVGSGETVLHLMLPFGFENEEPQEEGITRLMLHSLFYGTEGMDELAIAQRLDDLGLDRDPAAHVMVAPHSAGIRFRMPTRGEDQIDGATELLEELVRHPLLTLEQVARAQRELGTAFSSEQVRRCYRSVVVPDGAVVQLRPVGTSATSVETVEESFSDWPPSPRFIPNEASGRSLLVPREDTVDYDSFPAVGKSDVVIDDKIIMHEPSWYQTKSRSYWVGASVALIGILTLISGFLCPPSVAFYTMAGGGIVAAGSGYFFIGDFLGDPEVISSYRQQDLIAPFYSVYESKRAGITLTPFEARARFLRTSMERRNGRQSALAIYKLANSYELTDPVFLEMTTLQERQNLVEIRAEFVADKNLVTEGERSLKRELNQQLKPFEEERDRELQRLKESYDENYYVRREKEERQTRDQGIEQAKNDFKAGRSTEELRDEFIAQWESEYKEVVEDPEFAAGLERANTAHKENKDRVEKLFKEQEARIKAELKYDERLEYCRARRSELYTVHNIRLQSYLEGWPSEIPGLVDWRDLRN